MVVIDAVVRRIDGVLGDEGSSVDESFYDGLLEYPQYTRPAEYRGMEVPDIFLSGHHAKIAKWRREQSLCVPSAGDPIYWRALILVHLSEIFLILLETESLQHQLCLNMGELSKKCLFLLEKSNSLLLLEDGNEKG